MIMHEHADRESLARSVADALADGLRAALDDHGHATMAAPGGASPGPILKRLGDADIDWANVTVVPGDERWVPPTDERSNQRLIEDCFAGTRATAACIQPLYDGSSTPEIAATALRDVIAKLLPLDVCLLGMGLDGHTASLFPDSPELSDALSAPAGRPLVAVRPNSAPEPRITLSAPVLASAPSLHLIVTGPEKLTVLRAAQADGPVERLPVRAVLARSDINVHVAA